MSGRRSASIPFGREAWLSVRGGRWMFVRFPTRRHLRAELASLERAA